MKPLGQFRLSYTDDERQVVSRLMEIYQSICGKKNVHSEFLAPMTATNKTTRYVRVITLTSRKLGVTDAMYIASVKCIASDFISANYQQSPSESLPIRYRKKLVSALRRISVVVVGKANDMTRKGKH